MTHPGAGRPDRISAISYPRTRTRSVTMAVNGLHSFLFKRILRFAVLVLLTREVLSGDGICTKHEVVTKTKMQQVRKTYTRTFWSWCERYNRYYWRHESYQCQQSKTDERVVEEEQSYTQLETIQYCCPGYEDSRSGSHNAISCTPVCEFTCVSGKCTAPNFCECNAGYEKDPERQYFCKPVCSQQCIHGFCSSPEFCSCDSGYDHNSVSPSSYVCSPVCNKTCVNAECTAPDTCTCLQGFAKTARDSHVCHAMCSQPCHNGICSSPEECTCFDGYKKDNSTWNFCSPFCPDGCVNGRCTAPGECSCSDGFEKITGQDCQPVCSQGCLNGECVKPGVCSCLPGYESSLEDPFTCYPVCSPGCINGNCTDPDRCECFPGFEESEKPTVCQPYCSDGCENGICTQPEECTCLWGFQSEGNSSNCTRIEGENLDCTLLKEINNHDFNKSCFTITDEISLKELENCKILQLLISKHEEIDQVNFNLDCEPVSDLMFAKSKLALNLECIVKLNVEENLSTEEYSSSTLAYTEQQNGTDSFEYTTEMSYWETTEYPTSTETPDVNMTTGDYQSYTDIVQEQREFNIISENSSSRTIKMSDLPPLDLKMNLKFVPLITSLRITQDYFKNVNSQKSDWCLCHHNKSNWNICAFVPVTLHLCPCQPNKQLILREEPSSLLFLKTAAKFVIVLVAAILVAYIVFNMYRSGSYTPNGTEENTSKRAVLSFDLVSLGDNNAEENT